MKICDKCSGEQANTVRIQQYHKDGTSFGDYYQFDLCEKCHGELVDFLQEKKKPKKKDNYEQG